METHPMSISKSEGQYSEEEAQRRFKKTLKAALNSPPKPLKSMVSKKLSRQPKKRAR
jgi:hypothetical protein